MFEENIRRLHEIVETLEKGSVSLQTALALYAEGASLVASCKAALDDAEQIVRKVTENP